MAYGIIFLKKLCLVVVFVSYMPISNVGFDMSNDGNVENLRAKKANEHTQ